MEGTIIALELFGLVWFVLVSVRTFCVMCDHTFSELAIHQIRHQVTHKWAVSLVIAYGHFNIPRGFMFLCMD